MTLTVYRAPSTVGSPPDFMDYKVTQDYWDAENEYIERIGNMARNQYQNPNKLIGKVVRFQVADGYANYVVWKLRPLQLIFVDTGDSYSFPYIERLTVADIRENVEGAERLAELFGRKS